MPKSIYEIFDAKALAAYWTDVNVNMKDADISKRWFPETPANGLDLSWVKGRNNLPVALQPAAFDAKAPLRDRIGVSEIATEMPFFREGMRLGEKDRQNIQNLLARGEQFAQATILRVFDDTKNLIDGAIVQAERMRMSLLAKGTINIVASIEKGQNVAHRYVYDMDGSWGINNNVTLSGNGTWTVANKATSTPIQDILDVKIYMAENKGVQIVELLMNTTTLKGLLASDSIVKSMNPLGYQTSIYTPGQLKSYVESMTELKITVCDKMFKDEQGNDTKYYPDGYVTALPGYPLGNTFYGTTPENFDLMGGNANASVSVVNTGITITTVKEPHPVNVFTIVSAIMLPSFERMDDVYVMKAF